MSAVRFDLPQCDALLDAMGDVETKLSDSVGSNFLVRTEAGRDLANFGLTRVEKDGRVQILPSHLV